MKYLYKILRLFICSHKYKMYLEQNFYHHRSNDYLGRERCFKCKYCGKIKHERFI